MVTLSRTQLFDRWDALPQVIKDAIFSEANSDFIWKTCADENIPDEKIYDVAKISGYTLMGFVHPEDVAEEIKERLGIDIRTAKIVEDALNKRIYNPIRADIDKAYSPLSKLEIAPAPLSVKPSLNMGAIQKPTTLSDVGWSRASSTGPGIKLTTLPGAAQPSSGTTTPMPPRPITVGASSPSTTPAEPAPMILHEDTSFKAVDKNAGFTLTKPGMGAQVSMGQGSGLAPARPAVLEFGGAKPPTPPQNKPATTGQSGATHYSEFKVSLSAMPTANNGPRNVSQVAPLASTPAPAPKPPTPPTPPAPLGNSIPLPRPPQMAQPQFQSQPQPFAPKAPQSYQTPQPPKPTPPQPPQNNKPIVKDFL